MIDREKKKEGGRRKTQLSIAAGRQVVEEYHN
jgi:hypothetical protein